MKNLILFNLLGFNPDLTTRQSRVDSVSIASRYRVLAILLLFFILGSGNAWGAAVTIASWSGAARTADAAVAPTSSQTDNSSARLMSECTLNTAGSGGSAGAYYGTWTNGKCIYITGLNLTGYTGISLSINLRRRNATCTAAFYVSTDGSSYAKDAIDTKTLTNTSTNYEVSSIASNVQAIKIVIDGGSGNLWLGTASITGTAAAATPTVTPDPTSLSWGTVLQGSSQSTKTITITGANLTAGTLTISATGGYSVTPTSKSVSGTLDATTLTVTPPSTSTAGAKNGKVTISGGGLASNVEVNLSMTVNAASTVTWMNNGSEYTTTLVANGSKPEFPSNPSSCDGTSTTFVGWTPTPWSGKLDDVSAKTIYTSAASMPNVTGAVTYYAVFAKSNTTYTPVANTWTRITSTSQLTNGATVLLVQYNDDKAINTTPGATSCTAYSEITNSTANLRWTAVESGSKWKFKSSSNHYLSTESLADGTAIALDETYDEWTISADAGGYSNCFNLNNGNDLEYYSTFKVYTWSSKYKSAYPFYIYIQKTTESTTYDNYLTNCCTNLASINGSISFTPSATGGTLDWSSEEMTHTDGVYVKRSYTGITGSDPYYDWVHISSGTTSVTFSDLACGGGTTYTWYWKRKGATDYCDDSTPQSNTFTTTTCACSYYSFHYQHGSDWNTDNICFNPVSGGSNDYLTDELSLPYAEWYNVCWQGSGQSYTATKGFSGTTDNIPMKFYHKQDKSFGVNPQAGNIGGGLGKFHVVHNSGNTNKDVTFIPTGYTLNFGTGDWTHDSTLVFTGKTNDWDETEWYTPMTTLTNDAIGRKIFVGLKTSSGYVWCSPYSEKVNLSGLRTKSGSGENWVSGGLTTAYANKTGKFRIYANSGDNNWYVTFVPHYQLKYNANGGSGTMSPLPATPVSCEETSENRTVTVATSSFTAPAHKTFSKWHTAADGTSGIDVATGSRELTGDITLYAIWTYLPQYTVTLNAGANGSLSVDKASSYSDELGTVTITITPSSGYQLSSISAVDGSSNPVSLTGTGNSRTFTMPASNVTVTATFVVRTDYVLVTNVSELNDGDVITIANMKGNNAEGKILHSQADNNRNTKAVTTAADGKIADSDVEYPITLVSDASGWKLYDQENAGYLYAVKGSNYLKNSATPTPTYNDVWTIEIVQTAGDYQYQARIHQTACNGGGCGQESRSGNNYDRYIEFNSAILSTYLYNYTDGYIYKKELSCEKLAAPTGLTASSITQTTVTLSWNSVSNASGYEISLNNGSSWTSTSTNTSYNATGLTAGTTYNWKVRATGTGDYCAAGNAASSTVTMKAAVTVTYNSNGCTGGQLPVLGGVVNLTEGDTYTILGNTGNGGAALTKTGYTWAGWHNSTTYSATPAYTVGGTITVTENIILYANWAPKRDTYKDAVHGNADQYGDGKYTVPAALSDATRHTSGTCEETHYKFIGWCKEGQDPTNPANIVAPGTTDKPATGVNYYAVWAEEL